jgi:riboflavin biosynthesis pyrimidine reductase
MRARRRASAAFIGYLQVDPARPRLGPTLFGQFLRERQVDELFLTLAPLVAGRARDNPRLSLVEQTAFAPEDAPRPRLLSLKVADDYLFARFAISR